MIEITFFLPGKRLFYVIQLHSEYHLIIRPQSDGGIFMTPQENDPLVFLCYCGSSLLFDILFQKSCGRNV